MRYLYCFAVVTSFVVQNNNNQLENSLTETLTTMVSLSLQMCPRKKVDRPIKVIARPGPSTG